MIIMLINIIIKKGKNMSKLIEKETVNKFW